jgi:hypothetical protein
LMALLRCHLGFDEPKKALGLCGPAVLAYLHEPPTR